MRDVERRMNEVAPRLQVEVSRADTQRALARFEDRLRRRRRRTFAAAGLAAASIAALLAWVLVPPAAPPPAAVAVSEEVAPSAVEEAPPADTKRVIYFPDGSRAHLVRPRTQIRMEALSDDLLELVMDAGEARFEVQPNPGRLFRVMTESLRIEVLGTSFTVAEEADATRVTVHSGRVAVYRGQNRHELGSGMTLSFDGRRVVVEGAQTEVEVEKDAETDEGARVQEGAEAKVQKKPRPRKKRARRSRAKVLSKSRWKRLAKDGEFQAAYEAMSAEADRAVRDETQELMLAADVARLTGHPREAVEYLEQVVDRHRGHPRALLAAFTLGRILQHELDDPEEAATAFRNAYELGPGSSLAEDALAHEVECWAQAGRRQRARQRAKAYLERYPDGRKLRQVKRLGGL